MQTLILTVGIPASGKSTWALDYAKTNINVVIINRDSLRHMSGTYWVPDREALIAKYEEVLTAEAIAYGYSIIIDATNLNETTRAKYKQLAADNDMKFDLQLFPITLEKALVRDIRRGHLGEKTVGQDVIRMFHSKYEEQFAI